MDCRRCRANPELRRAWGCDEPTPYPFATLTVGDERIDLTTCPVKLVRRTPQVLQALTAYRWLNTYRLPPDAGGSAEQTASFAEAVQVIEDERASIARLRGK